MATVTVVETVHKAGNHLECEACLAPSLGWLSPRISFSKDFAQSEDTEKADYYKRREKVDRDSLSEFEFSLSVLNDNSATGSQMLAADELFFKGKLLPIYVPQYTEQSVKRSGKGERSEGVSNLTVPQKIADRTQASSPRAADSSPPVSPKTPRSCPTKLKVLLGLKKVKSQCMQGRSCKPRAKQKASKQKKTPLARKALRLFCRSDDTIVPDAPNSTGEPLLGSAGEIRASCSSNAISLQQQQTKHQQSRNHLEKSASVLVPCTSFSSAATAPRTSRTDREPSLGSHLRVKVRPMEEKRRSCERKSGESSPARRSGAMSPARTSSGHWSPGRHSTGGWSPGRSSGAASPSRVLLGEAGFGEGARSLERSSSSPKSLRRRYDHLKAMRQREGWRGLERSSSYSSVRVAPVLNVPVCLSPGFRAGRRSKNFGLGQLFSVPTSKPVKDQTPSAAHNIKSKRFKRQVSNVL